MAVDIMCMQENLRWEGVPATYHLKELEQYGEFNYFISEYFDPPPPAVGVLNALAVLMDWRGDTKQIVTKATGQRHTEEPTRPEHYAAFLRELAERSSLERLPEERRATFRQRMTELIAWQKFDEEASCYKEMTPMNSYDVLKCSQACFHLFEWLRSLLPAAERPKRYVESDITAYRSKEREMRPKGLWPEEPPPGPTARPY
eukprot:TRINITY_DN64767_c0_g1_i1.p1 TRINITY_DN64767_c0_g1~~TRINITY_DN64767_c0_g1_i1.p1  ORF type:complete len:202 (-),score=54.31 TRINITY_DN64767_c0_g1_i1:37-642(-)